MTGSPTGGNYKLLVDNKPTATIAHNATSSVIASAINAVSGISGATVTGTAPGPMAVTFTDPTRLSLDSHTLTGGTTPNVTVAKVAD